MQKERILVKQKEGQEYLIHSIFPPVIAKDLIKKHTNKESMLTFDRIQSTIASVESEGEGGSIGGVVARSHHRVTILFTGKNDLYPSTAYMYAGLAPVTFLILLLTSICSFSAAGYNARYCRVYFHVPVLQATQGNALSTRSLHRI